MYNLKSGSNTPTERKFWIPQIRGRKGEAVVVYREPLITKKMGYYELFHRVNKLKIFIKFY
jgi:hypothetical protein